MIPILRSRLHLLPLLLLLAVGSATAQRKTLTPASMTFKGLKVGMTQEELSSWFGERSSFLKTECQERGASSRQPEVFDGAEYCNFTFIFEQRGTPEAQQFRRIATTNDRREGDVDADAFILFAYLYNGSVYGITAGTPDETDRNLYVLQLRALYDAMYERYGTPNSGMKDPAASATAAKKKTEERVDVAVWSFSSGGHNYEIKLQARHHSGKDYESWITYNDVTLLNAAYGATSSGSGSRPSSSGSEPRSNF